MAPEFMSRRCRGERRVRPLPEFHSAATILAIGRRIESDRLLRLSVGTAAAICADSSAGSNASRLAVWPRGFEFADQAAGAEFEVFAGGDPVGAEVVVVDVELDDLPVGADQVVTDCAGGFGPPRCPRSWP
jgi:hypothetical protein